MKISTIFWTLFNLLDFNKFYFSFSLKITKSIMQLISVVSIEQIVLIDIIKTILSNHLLYYKLNLPSPQPNPNATAPT